MLTLLSKVESVVLAYGFDDLLVEIGSSLGLWLGLSVVGMFDVFVPSFAWLKKACKARVRKKPTVHINQRGCY